MSPMERRPTTSCGEGHLAPYRLSIDCRAGFHTCRFSTQRGRKYVRGWEADAEGRARFLQILSGGQSAGVHRGYGMEDGQAVGSGGYVFGLIGRLAWDVPRRDKGVGGDSWGHTMKPCISTAFLLQCARAWGHLYLRRR